LRGPVRAGFRLLASVLALGIVPALANAGAPQRSASTSTPRAAGSSQATGGALSSAPQGITLSGRLSPGSVNVGETVRFWLPIENRSAGPLGGVPLDHLDAPGFQVTLRCWGDQATDPACRAADEPAWKGSDACKSSGDLLCQELPPNASVTVWGNLQAIGSSDPHQAFATVRWTQNGFDSRRSVELGSLESVHDLIAFWRNLSGVSLSAVVAFFGAVWSLYRYFKDRSDAAEKTEKERKLTQEKERSDALARDAAQLADRQRETLNLLLKEIQRFALTYYMPFASDIQN